MTFLIGIYWFKLAQVPPGGLNRKLLKFVFQTVERHSGAAAWVECAGVAVDTSSQRRWSVHSTNSRCPWVLTFLKILLKKKYFVGTKWPEYETTLTCLLYLTFAAEGKDSECAAGCQKTPPCCEVDIKLTFPLYGRSLSSNSVVEIVQGLGDIRQPIIYHECRLVCRNFI